MRIIYEVDANHPVDWATLSSIRQCVSNTGVGLVEDGIDTLHEAIAAHLDVRISGFIVAVRMARDTPDLIGNWRVAYLYNRRIPKPLLRTFRALMRALKWNHDTSAVHRTGLHRAGVHSVDDFERANATSFARFLRHLGAQHRLVFVTPVSDDVEVYNIFDHTKAQGPFTETQLNEAWVLSHLLQDTMELWVRQLGVLHNDAVLPPREREVLVWLLRGASEVEAADAVGLRPSSLHQVVVNLYRRFGVRSRPELLAAVLHLPPDRRPSWVKTRINIGEVVDEVSETKIEP